MAWAGTGVRPQERNPRKRTLERAPILADFADQKALGGEELGGARQDAPDDIQAVGSPGQSERRLDPVFLGQ